MNRQQSMPKESINKLKNQENCHNPSGCKEQIQTFAASKYTPFHPILEYETFRNNISDY